ncbi:MAG: hypothetical protein Q9179_000424 [Wetmoreana sp. 5 TL-2023]
MATQSLLNFYDEILKRHPSEQTAPLSLKLVVMNPGTMGSKGGLVVDQLTAPDLPGKITAVYDAEDSSWHLHTSNVHRLHIDPAAANSWFRSVISIDDSHIKLLKEDPVSCQWLVSTDSHWSRDQRHGRQLGGLDAILSTRGRFLISTPIEAFSFGIQISRNLFQYFGADTEIVTPGRSLTSDGGNRISLLLGRPSQMPLDADHSFPIYVDKDKGLVVHNSYGRRTSYGFEDGLGAIFLRPNAGETLEVVIWGSDISGLRHAARLLPMLAGVGQPDFVIVGKECAWQGAAGVRGLGHFDSLWNITDRSVVLQRR